MQREIDWRHWLLAGIAVGLLVLVGWQLANRSAAPPNEPAPAGPHARMQDAPEQPPPGHPRH